MTARDYLRLEGTHPRLKAAVASVLGTMEVLGHPMFVVEGLRSTARQQALYAQGRSKPGPIVTNADGVKTLSNHQAHPDGEGHAVDCAFVGPHPFAEEHPWADYGRRAITAGLSWGGSWAHPDRPHIELP